MFNDRSRGCGAGPRFARRSLAGAIVLFGILGAAIVSLTMLPALTVAALNWRRPAL